MIKKHGNPSEWEERAAEDARQNLLLRNEIVRLKEHIESLHLDSGADARARWFPISEIHEEYGDCILVNVDDCGYMEIGGCCSLDFDESQWTHFAKIPAILEADHQRMIEEARMLAPEKERVM